MAEKEAGEGDKYIYYGIKCTYPLFWLSERTACAGSFTIIDTSEQSAQRYCSAYGFAAIGFKTS